ncbi:MAG: glycosyltransferase family 4 protein [Deltaproteobacteria bacterium]|nr:glycosyltransferase family 4 protein [Deltaproteobacteria bacterium]
MPVPEHPAIRWLGYVSEQEKFDALAASAVMVAPSPYESLSMASLESWLMETPVLVTTRSAVLRGQVHRSQGGLAYSSYDEFADSLDRLLGDRGEAREMGRRGRAYVVERYRWEEIERKYLALVQGLG